MFICRDIETLIILQVLAKFATIGTIVLQYDKRFLMQSLDEDDQFSTAATINHRLEHIKHVGVFLALCGVCVCALMQILLAPIGRGFTGQCLDIGAWDLAAAMGGRVPDAVVTFAPGQEASGAWQEVKGEAMSVNEALYAGAIEGTVRKLTMV